MPLRIDFQIAGRMLSYMQQSGKWLTILLTKDEVVAIDDFRFENRMRNRSDAVRALLNSGTGSDRRRPSKTTVTTCAVAARQHALQMCERGAAIRPHVGIAAVALDHLRAHADDVADLGVYWRRLARTVATN